MILERVSWLESLPNSRFSVRTPALDAIKILRDITLKILIRCNAKHIGINLMPEKQRERNQWIYDMIFCADCGAHVPVFHDLAPPEEAIVQEWLKADSPPYHREVSEVTGMSKPCAKAWVLHMRGEIVRKGCWNTASCPKCKRWLRTPQAKQCFHCGHKWHTSKK